MLGILESLPKMIGDLQMDSPWPCEHVFWTWECFVLKNSLKHSFSEHAEKFGYGIVDRFVGHGIGTVFHSEPLILHHRE